MDCGMSAISLNYDRKFDILYARRFDYTPSYGDDNEDGIVTYYSIETDAVTGMAIFDVKKKLQRGEIQESLLPIPIDLYSTIVQTLLNDPEKGFQCVLQLA